MKFYAPGAIAMEHEGGKAWESSLVCEIYKVSGYSFSAGEAV